MAPILLSLPIESGLTGADAPPLRFPAVDPCGPAPRFPRSPSIVGAKDVTERLPNHRLRKMAPALWQHLLHACKPAEPRSDSQRGRWAEFRTRFVQSRVAKVTQGRLTPLSLGEALLQVAEANNVRDHHLEAVCGLMALKTGSAQCCRRGP